MRLYAIIKHNKGYIPIVIGVYSDPVKFEEQWRECHNTVYTTFYQEEHLELNAGFSVFKGKKTEPLFEFTFKLPDGKGFVTRTDSLAEADKLMGDQACYIVSQRRISDGVLIADIHQRMFNFI